MLQTHFVLVIEPTPAFINMGKLLLHSLRENGGNLEDAPVTVVSNGRELPKDQVAAYRSFTNVEICPMSRLAGPPHANKFNAFYAIDRSFDVLVFLDCDMVVMRALDQLVEDCDPDGAIFRALPIGNTGADQVHGYRGLIRQYAHPDCSIDELRDERFVSEYPLFNTGTMVLTREAVRSIREDAVRINYQLHERYLREDSPQTIGSGFVQRVWKAAHRRLLPPVQKRAGYSHWMTEQLALALAVLKNEVCAAPLSPQYNWVPEQAPNETELPCIYHYMSGLHDIDRAALFDGDWIGRYEQSRSPNKRELAKLARSYSEQSVIP